MTAEPPPRPREAASPSDGPVQKRPRNDGGGSGEPATAADGGRSEEVPPAHEDDCGSLSGAPRPPHGLQEHTERFRLCGDAAAAAAADPTAAWLDVRVLSDAANVVFKGVGARLWDASRVLSQLLLRPTALGEAWSTLLRPAASQDRPLRVLELGAGTALPSVCLASCGHEVVATDLLDLVPLARANLEANRSPTTGRCTARPLVFGDCGAAWALGEFDVVVGSDVAYDPADYEPLLRTLQALAGPWHALLAISQRTEDLGEETFENFCRDEEVPLRLRYTALAAGSEVRRINIYEVEARGLPGRFAGADAPDEEEGEKEVEGCSDDLAAV